MGPWVDIPDQVYETLEEAAAVKAEHYRDATWSMPSNCGNEYLVTGLAGEWLYSEMTGQTFDPFRMSDDGIDFFDGVDVKTTTTVPPTLKVRFTSKKQPDAVFYALCQFDHVDRRVRYVGYATRGDVLAADVVSNQFYVLPAGDLDAAQPGYGRPT